MSVRNITYDRENLFQNPIQPGYSPQCATNVYYNTLPCKHPIERVMYGSASVKHIYPDDYRNDCSSIGKCRYDNQHIWRPKGTLYETPNATYGQHGRLVSYGYKPYPVTDWSPREVEEFGCGILPVPAIQRWQGRHGILSTRFTGVEKDVGY